MTDDEIEQRIRDLIENSLWDEEVKREANDWLERLIVSHKAVEQVITGGRLPS